MLGCTHAHVEKNDDKNETPPNAYIVVFAACRKCLCSSVCGISCGCAQMLMYADCLCVCVCDCMCVNPFVFECLCAQMLMCDDCLCLEPQP